jgi:hypothetical protein
MVLSFHSLSYSNSSFVNSPGAMDGREDRPKRSRQHQMKRDGKANARRESQN